MGLKSFDAIPILDGLTFNNVVHMAQLLGKYQILKLY
jgi:hypothetical protein